MAQRYMATSAGFEAVARWLHCTVKLVRACLARSLDSKVFSAGTLTRRTPRGLWQRVSPALVEEMLRHFRLGRRPAVLWLRTVQSLPA